MSIRLVLGLISFCFALTGIFLANIFLTMMIGEINRKRNDTDLVSYFGFGFSKMRRIFVEYRLAYPQGLKDTYALTAFAVGMAGLVGVAACLGSFG